VQILSLTNVALGVPSHGNGVYHNRSSGGNTGTTNPFMLPGPNSNYCGAYQSLESATVNVACNRHETFDVVVIDGKAASIIARNFNKRRTLKRHPSCSINLSLGGYGNDFILSTNARVVMLLQHVAGIKGAFL